jgi:hypothetical protein
MKNLKGKTVKIDQFLTSDPFNKRGETGTITDVKIIDEENADVTIKFEDGVIGLYEYGTFEIVK